MICGCRRATGAGVVAAVRNRAPPSRSIVADAHARTRALWPGVHIFHLFGHPAAARRANSGGAGSSDRARRSVPSARRIPAGARIERDERQGEVLGPGAAAARGTRRPVAARPCRRPQRRGREALRVDRARAHPGTAGRTQVLMAAGRSSAAGPAPVTNRSRPTARAAKLPSAAAPTSLGSVAGMSPPIRAGMRPWSASTSASASGPFRARTTMHTPDTGVVKGAGGRECPAEDVISLWSSPRTMSAFLPTETAVFAMAGRLGLPRHARMSCHDQPVRRAIAACSDSSRSAGRQRRATARRPSRDRPPWPRAARLGRPGDRQATLTPRPCRLLGPVRQRRAPRPRPTCRARARAVRQRGGGPALTTSPTSPDGNGEPADRRPDSDPWHDVRPVTLQAG